MNFYGLILYVYGERRMESSLSNRQGIKSNLILDFIASGPLWIDRRCSSASVHFLSGETFSSCRWCMKSWPKSLCQRTCRGWKELRICGGTRTNRSKSWKKLTKTEKWEWPMTLVMNHNRPSTFETKSSSLHSSQCYKNYLYSLNIAKVYIQLT